MDSTPYPEVYAKDNYIFYKDPETGEEQSIGKAFHVVKIIHDIDTNNFNYKFCHGKVKVDVLPSTITPSGLIKLADSGFDIRHDNSKMVYKYVRNEIQNAPVKYFHSSSGWGYYNGKLVFKCNNIIGSKITSTYKGKYDLSSSGTLEEWLHGIQSLVVGRIGLELALIGAVSSVTVGLIGHSIAQNSFLVSFVGESSTGKTTALNLATSFFGNASQSGNSVFKCWTGTDNALITNLQGNYGIVCILDDTSSAQISNFGDIIYRFSNNADKARLDSTSKVITTDGWRTVILSTGESPLLGLKDVKGGIRTRMLELI